MTEKVIMTFYISRIEAWIIWRRKVTVSFLITSKVDFAFVALKFAAFACFNAKVFFVVVVLNILHKINNIKKKKLIKIKETQTPNEFVANQIASVIF
jgi:hypothetical protein